MSEATTPVRPVLCDEPDCCGVRFTEKPRTEPYGRVVVFLDLYGNKWDLIEKVH